MRIESFGHRVIESFYQWLNDAMTQLPNVFPSPQSSLLSFLPPAVSCGKTAATDLGSHPRVLRL